MSLIGVNEQNKVKLVVTTMAFAKMDIGGFDAYDDEERLVKAAIEGSTFMFTIELLPYLLAIILSIPSRI